MGKPAIADRYTQEILALTAAAATIRRVRDGEADGTMGSSWTVFEARCAEVLEYHCPDAVHDTNDIDAYTRWLRRKADTFTDAAKEREKLLRVYGVEPPTHPEEWSDETAHAGFNLGMKLGFFGDHDDEL